MQVNKIRYTGINHSFAECHVHPLQLLIVSLLNDQYTNYHITGPKVLHSCNLYKCILALAFFFRSNKFWIFFLIHTINARLWDYHILIHQKSNKLNDEVAKTFQHKKDATVNHLNLLNPTSASFVLYQCYNYCFVGNQDEYWRHKSYPISATWNATVICIFGTNRGRWAARWYLWSMIHIWFF